MERNKEEELKAEEAVAKAKKVLEDRKKDACPSCNALVAEFPYMMADVTRGWIECCYCGRVFSPKSIRDMKKEKAKSRIVTP